jgi:hypothetical protein
MSGRSAPPGHQCPAVPIRRIDHVCAETLRWGSVAFWEGSGFTFMTDGERGYRGRLEAGA